MAEGKTEQKWRIEIIIDDISISYILNNDQNDDRGKWRNEKNWLKYSLWQLIKAISK